MYQSAYQQDMLCGHQGASHIESHSYLSGIFGVIFRPVEMD